MLDDAVQGLGGGLVEVEALGGAQGQLAAHLGVVAVAVGFAHVVEEQSQIEHEGPLQLLEERSVGGVGRGFGLPDAVQLLDAHQRVLVGGVLVVELVLHQAGELAELGQVLAQQIHFVHGAQDRRDAPALVEDGQEAVPHVLVRQERAVHQVAGWLRMSWARSGCRRSPRCWA